LLTLLFVGQPADCVPSSSITAGKLVFHRASCAMCHPGGGNVVNPNKPLKGAAFAQKYKSDQELQRVIRQGVKNTSMPPFDKQTLNDADLLNLIAYIRSFTPGK
jgi:mono/diheme cytochrome c family protein